jgi:hypothetical protein
LDQKGGDAGSIYKRSEIVPQMFFVRASFIAKSSSTMPHPELQAFGKQLKQFYITTGLGIAYHNDFEI